MFLTQRKNETLIVAVCVTFWIAIPGTSLSSAQVELGQNEHAAVELDHIEFFESRVRPLLIDRCYECHSGDSEVLRAGLRLDRRDDLLKGGDSGPAIIPGNPEESLLIEAVKYQSYEMPPEGKLTDAEIAALERWIEIGAPWPAETEGANAGIDQEGYDWEQAIKHWAFQPIVKPDPPKPLDGNRNLNPIDRFVNARLHEAGLPQPRSAAKGIFVRRAFIDLIGIPPTPEERRDWVSKLGGENGSWDEDGVAELVDALLERPQYGERWARHWLDVARYSDVGGWTQDNAARPMAWRYRDWVVQALNSDLPYDQFVRQQIVGDQIDQNAAVGTGLFALGPNYKSDGGDPESVAQAKGETLDDRVDTFSRAFLGLTVSCARCHDHKFDPIPTQDYYSIAGIFNNTREGESALVDESVVREFHEHQQSIRDAEKALGEARKAAADEQRELTDEEQQNVAMLEQRVNELKSTAPKKYDFAHSIHDSGGSDMNVALRGNLLKEGEIAPRRFLRIIAGEERESFQQGSGRSQLADAVIEPNNPLTARVFVNRVWMHHFGKGLVRTPNNFGVLGESPTHPQMMDWLAATFIESGWSIKSLHRVIMTSATYRSSSDFDERAFDIDGDNRMLWRMNPRRMDVESWRDSLLFVSESLDMSLGGASTDNILTSRRRTLYARISRNDPRVSDEFLRLFDFPIPRASSAERSLNIIPQQFLFMMNSQFMVERARDFANRLKENTDSIQEQVELGYDLLFGRLPSEEEVKVAVRFLEQTPAGESTVPLLEQYCQVLLSSNEFMFVR